MPLLVDEDGSPTEHFGPARKLSDLPSSSMTEPIMAEAAAFMTTLGAVDPNQMTKASEWTAHELVAHMAAGAAEIARNVVAFSEGGPNSVPATRELEERETPYRQMEFDTLCSSLRKHQDEMMDAIAVAMGRDPAALTPWAGRQMPVGAFLSHIRSEFTLHRWDLVGDDTTSTELLSQPELTAHAVLALGAALASRGQAAGATGQVRLASPGEPDILVSPDGAVFAEDEPSSDEAPAIVSDPAARLLLLWGRTPDEPGRVVTPGGMPQLMVLRGLLAGY